MFRVKNDKKVEVHQEKHTQNNHTVTMRFSVFASIQIHCEPEDNVEDKLCKYTLKQAHNYYRHVSFKPKAFSKPVR